MFGTKADVRNRKQLEEVIMCKLIRPVCITHLISQIRKRREFALFSFVQICRDVGWLVAVIKEGG